MKAPRVHLVDGKKVAIIKSNTHTYNIRYVKSGLFTEVHKKYVTTWYPKPKRKAKSLPKPKPINPQFRLEF